jgi:hypothetical protein
MGPDRLQIVRRDPEQHADHPHGHLAPRSATKSNPVATDQRVEGTGAELPDLWLEGVHLLRA